MKVFHPSFPRRALRARRRDSRGAALVEAAIVTPLLLILVFGIIEFGFVFKDSLTLANSSRAGARMASAATIDPLADFYVLQAIKGASGSLTQVQRIVVFKATGPTDKVPPACLTGGLLGTCNTYDQTDLSITQASFLAGTYTKDDSWPSASRVTSIASPTGPDYLGVYVSAQHNSVFQIVLPSRTLHDSVVMRLEPTR